MQIPGSEMIHTWDDTAELLLSKFFPAGTEQRFTIREDPLGQYERSVDEERVKAAIW